MKIIPAVDIRGGRCVRLFQGDYNQETVYNDDPTAPAVKWAESGAELLHLVDLDGAKAGHIVNGETIERICNAVEIPCELGGGIRTIEDAEEAFSLGISRIILGTVACETPEIAEEFINRFGREKIVVGIDAKDGRAAVRGWLENSGADAFTLARKLFLTGVSRIIFTDIATDGALKGPNLASIAKLCSMVPDCKIIASGGASSPDDVKNLIALRARNLEGVIVGKALYDGRTTFQAMEDAASKADEA